MKALVNTDKLYSVIGKFFTNKDNLMFELIQNAARAKATRVEISAPCLDCNPFSSDTSPDNLIRITDNGQGITDIVALLGIAISDWDKDIDQQDPAGMGFLQLLALSRQVSITSAFGHVLIDSQRFLQEHDYRLGIVNAVYEPIPGHTGTVIIAEMQTSAFFYLKSDYSWYSGYQNLALDINGKDVEPISMEKLAEAAELKKNLVHRTEYMGNSLFIEIGDPGLLVGTNRSCVNWYGQLIPACFDVDHYLSSMFIRYYYEIRTGTPLTPRYPDRTMLTWDDKWDAFSKFLVETITKVLADYFLALESSGFRNWTSYHLLQFLYRHGDRETLEQVKWVPVDPDVFTSQDHYNFGIMDKADLKDKGYHYCTSDLLADDDYYLAFETDLFKIVKVSSHAAGYLKSLDLKEVTEINTINLDEGVIQLKPLRLDITCGDDSQSVLILQEALLYDHNYGIHVIAPEAGSVLSVFDNYWEDVAAYNSDEPVEDQEQTLRDEVWQALTRQFKLMPDDKFSFLPRYSDLKKIEFEDGNLAVSYKDGTSLNFALR